MFRGCRVCGIKVSVESVFVVGVVFDGEERDADGSYDVSFSEF